MGGIGNVSILHLSSPGPILCACVCTCLLRVCSGPEGTSFDGGVFVTELLFPTDYPLSPPKMKFISEMFHPNGKISVL